MGGSVVGAESQEVRELFFAEHYTTNAIADAFQGASRSEVLLVKGVMDAVAERTKQGAYKTHSNAHSLNAAITALVAAITSLRSAALAVSRVGEGQECEDQRQYAQNNYDLYLSAAAERDELRAMLEKFGADPFVAAAIRAFLGGA